MAKIVSRDSSKDSLTKERPYCFSGMKVCKTGNYCVQSVICETQP